MRIALVIWLTLLAVAQAIFAASPVDPLASPDQATRDRAAKEIRATFQPIPRNHWDPLLKSLQKGQTEAEVLAILKSFQVAAKPRAPRPKGPSGAPIFDDGFSDVADYRLDDQWSLRAAYDITQERLYQFSLEESLAYLWIDPPKGFTGTWVVYYRNGVAAFRIDYQDGRYEGTFTQFKIDGSRKHVQHYIRNRLIGPDEWY